MKLIASSACCISAGARFDCKLDGRGPPSATVEPALPGHRRRPPQGEGAKAPLGGAYFNQPRFLKYHMGPSALASISAST